MQKRPASDTCNIGSEIELNEMENDTNDKVEKEKKMPPKWKLRLHALVYWLSLAALGFFVVAPKTIVHEPFKWVVFAVVVSLAVDEMCQVVRIGKGFCRNLNKWRKSVWNIIDLIVIILFFLGFTLTYYHTYLSKVVFSCYFFISCMKAMQFFKRMMTFGVYLVMIRKMLKTMVKFMAVFFISIIGCGLFLTALLHPDAALNGDILLHILFRPSLVLFGETGIERFELNNHTTIFGTSKVNLLSEIMVLVVMALFLLFSNILLVNLLIAEFSAIHEETKERATEISMFEQYELLEEFKQKPMMPIPLSIFENAWFLFKACKRGSNGESLRPEVVEEEVAKFERFCYRKLFPKIPDDIGE